MPTKKKKETKPPFNIVKRWIVHIHQAVNMTVFTTLLLLFTACDNSSNKKIDAALQMAYIQPDSALAQLDCIDRHQLSAKEHAKYALVYYMAQDKSGMDVNNDSIIRIAYNWYKTRPGDSLYALCQNYMGNYYVLNDSTEQAVICFKESIKSAKKQNDTATTCLALHQLSKLKRMTKTKECIILAKEAASTYESYSKSTQSNKVYYTLNVAENYFFMDSTDTALKWGKKAVDIAQITKDPQILSNVYQDLSSFYNAKGDMQLSLYCAKKSYQGEYNPAKAMVLAKAYIFSDSIPQAEKIIHTIPTNITPLQKYALYGIKALLEKKKKNIRQQEIFTDSASKILQQLYTEQLNCRSINNETAQAKEQELEKSNKHYLSIITFLITVCIISISTISYLWYRRFRSSTNNRNLKDVYPAKESETSNQKERLEVLQQHFIKETGAADIIEKLRKGEKIELSDTDWDKIESYLDTTDHLFVNRLRQKYPLLSEKDIRLMMILRLDLPQKTIAAIYSVSEKSIKQKLFLYKQKVGIQERNVSLRAFIKAF